MKFTVRDDPFRMDAIFDHQKPQNDIKDRPKGPRRRIKIHSCDRDTKSKGGAFRLRPAESSSRDKNNTFNGPESRTPDKLILGSVLF